MKIFLDDDPIRDSWVDDTWTIVRTADEAIALLDKGRVTEMSLDHDLGEDKTGYDVVRYIETMLGVYGNEIFNPPKLSIHSANPVGRKNMQAAIDSIERMRNGCV